MKRSRFTEEQIIGILKEHEAGTPVSELCLGSIRSEAAAAEAETSIPRFGKFKVKATPEREGRNPGTGEKMKIAASRKLAFTPAKALKDARNT